MRWLWLVLGLLSAAYLLRPPAPESLPASASVLSLGELMRGESEGFLRVEGPRPFTFPRDHGPHPGYRTEWWYVTANLDDPEGRRFGLQFTLFRFGLARTEDAPGSAWHTRDVYMGHLAVTDVAGNRHHAWERFSRTGPGLAGAEAQPPAVWLDDWRLAALPGTPDGWQLRAGQGEWQVDLSLTPLKPRVLQGEAGYSRKGAGPGNASYYYSRPRLAAQGRLRLPGAELAVSGLAWLDREWSSSALDEGQVGWDWFALHLDDGRELMLYRMRRRDGRADPHSAGSWIAADGTRQALGSEDFSLQGQAGWSAADGRATYPLEWRLRVPGQDLELWVRPVIADQEMALSVRYWEGAVDVEGQVSGRSVSGRGYMELTGYAEPVGGDARAMSRLFP